MTPPPLPPGCSGWPVAPDIHTGLPEPDRDGWTDTADEAATYVAGLIRDRDSARAALDIAVTGLRELETVYDSLIKRIDGSEDDRSIVYRRARNDLSALLDKIGDDR